ncbi:pilus assembly protein CpaD [Aureimonas leprariae]|uniref:Pilus assembly protein CpaD n=2 Tax=Plantimonas leprariae TaxID=2615207 RepID=A0A7V7TYH7_9HYPH|nr:pilus assembly protein CpaD [Aureimonas leprariae]
MPRPVLRLAFALGASLLAACADRHSIEVGSVPDDYRTRHPIVVDEDTALLEIPVTSSDIRLSVPAKGRIEDFAGQFRASRSAAMRVLLPAGSANERAAELASRDVVATLRHAGVPRDRILLQPYHADGQAGAVPIRLSYATLAAKTAPCGRWPEDLGETSENKQYFNFGCASQQNLAAQVADPRDLLGPRGRSPIDAARRTEMLESYRTGDKTSSAAPAVESDYDW